MTFFMVTTRHRAFKEETSRRHTFFQTEQEARSFMQEMERHAPEMEECEFGATAFCFE